MLGAKENRLLGYFDLNGREIISVIMQVKGRDGVLRYDSHVILRAVVWDVMVE